MTTELERLRAVLEAAPVWKGEGSSLRVRRDVPVTYRGGDRWAHGTEQRWSHLANVGTAHAAASGALGTLWPHLLAVVQAADRYSQHDEAPEQRLVVHFAAVRAEARGQEQRALESLRSAIREHLGEP